MIVYWAMFLIPAVLSLYETHERGLLHRLALPALFAVYFLIMAFRETGGDYITYLNFIQVIEGRDFSYVVERTEILYALLNYYAVRTGLGIYGVNTVCAAVFLFGLYQFIRHEPLPFLTFTIAASYLIIVVAIGYTRQGTAIGLLLWSIVELRRGHTWRFGALLALAIGFHTSAVVGLLFLLGGLRIRNRLLRYGTAIMLTGIVLAFVIYGASTTIDRYVYGYLESDRYSSDGALLRIAMSLGAALIWFVLRTKLTGVDRGIAAALSIIAVACAIGIPFQSTIADRIALYALPLQLIVFGRLPMLFADRHLESIVRIAILLVFGLAFAIWLHLGNFAQDLWLPFDHLLFGEIA